MRLWILRAAVVWIAVIVALAAVRCGGGTSTGPSPTPTPDPPGTIPPPPPDPPPSQPQSFVGAGDIAWCGRGADQTARVVQALPGQVFTAGDNAYPDGSLRDFMNCYEPTWGRFRDRTRPVAGNHEYETDPTARGYFTYFGALASPATEGYYSYEVGDWHIVALNSALPAGAFRAGSAQMRWLAADLEAHPKRCVAAIWHHPLFTSGPNGPQEFTRDAWRVLYQYGVDVVINGHDHLYERFAPQDPDGRRDPARGIRQFTIGTGGAELYGVRNVSANSEVRISNVYGVLKFTLDSTGYDWQFIPVAGSTGSDSGRDVCR